jgi:uncharacterized membrane protein
MDWDPDREQWERWKNDPSKWFWGIFYYNKEDKRLIVPKKVEWMGATINFAHPMGMGAVILLVAFLGILTTLAAAGRH